MRINTGNFGNVVAGPERAVNVGAPIGEGVRDIGAVLRRQELEAEAEAKRAQEQAMAEARANRRAADQAQATAKINLAADRLRDVAIELDDGVQTGSIGKDAVHTEWEARSKKVLDEAMADMPDSFKPLAAPALDSRRQMMRSDVDKIVRKRDQSDTLSGINQTLEHAQRLYQTDPATAQKLATDTLTQLGPFAGLAPDKISGTLQRWKENAQYVRGLEAVNAGRNDRAALDKADALIAGLPDLDPKQRAELTDRVASRRLILDQKAEMQAQRAARMEETRLRRAEATFNAFQAVADKGVALDPAYVDETIQRTAGTPYAEAVRGVAQQIKDVGGLAAQPVPVQQATLDAIDQQIAKNGANPAILKRREQVEKVVRASQQDYDKDALRAGQERGLIEVKPLQLGGGLPGLMPQLAERVAQADVVRTARGGKPTSPLLPEEAAAVAQLVRALPATERGEMVQQMATTVGKEQAIALAAQIDQHDRALGLAMRLGARRTTEGRSTAVLLFKGDQALKDKAVAKDDKALTGPRARAAEYLGDAALGSVREDVLDAAVMLTYGMQADGQSMDVPRAVRLALGGNVIDHAGRRTVVPAGMDAAALEKRLLNVTPAEITRQSPGGKVMAGGVAMSAEEFVKTLPGQQLMPISPGKFVPLVGGRPVLNDKGQPIVIGVD